MKKIVFICRDNSCLSQMAEAFAVRFGKGIIDARSAGIHPAPEGDRMAKAAMRERGFEVGEFTPRGLDSLHNETFDLCVHFGCPEADLPAALCAGGRVDWGGIADPAGKPYAAYRKAREEIGARILGLIRQSREKA
ncbi:MAG: hypothetical protein NTX71_08860 [Candidatus Aureabacteria bacterium]|nr:hypothetical protein [Candidatus Auribacterota bacterium]